MENFVSFELAKLLKEKGFDIPVLSYYFGDRFCLNYSVINQYSQEYIEDKGECLIIPYTSGEGNLYLETINFNSWGITNYSAPTIAEVVMWLYTKHKIWVVVNVGKPHNSEIMFYANVIKLGLHHKNKHRTEFHNTPTEAYEAAIKHTLKNLL